MKRHPILLAVFAFIMTHPAPARAGVLWYNGDFDGNSGLADMLNGGGILGIDSFVYDNFTVFGSTYNVTDVFGYFLADTNAIPSAQYELRQDVSTGDGGTLLFSGSSSGPAWTATSTTIFDAGLGETLTLYELDLTVSGVSLTPGTYWLGLRPMLDSTQDENVFVASTSGSNATGFLAGNAFWTSDFFGANFDLTTDDGYPSDYSYGADAVQQVSGTPEPEAMLLTAAGLAALLARERRHSERQSKDRPTALRSA